MDVSSIHQFASASDLQHVSDMTSTDFAAAQQRVLARRQGRTAELQKQRALLRSQRDASAIGRLPFPLHGFAQSGLETWDIVKGREGTRPSFRVGQVDAELLDEELLELLTGQVGEALKLFGVGDTAYSGYSKPSN